MAISEKVERAINDLMDECRRYGETAGNQGSADPARAALVAAIEAEVEAMKQRLLEEWFIE